MKSSIANNAIIYYSSTLFKNASFSNRFSALHVGFLATVVLRCELHPLAAHQSYRQTSAITVHDHSHGSGNGHSSCPRIPGPVQNIGRLRSSYCWGGHAVLIQGAFTIGFQATVWVYPSEILPLQLKQKGSSISTAANWICNFLIV